MIGADSRSTMGHIIANKNAMKLHRITDTIYAGGAGTAADLGKVGSFHHEKELFKLQVTQMIGAEMKMYELNNEGKKARVIMAHRRLRHYLYQVFHIFHSVYVCHSISSTNAILAPICSSGVWTQPVPISTR